MDNITDRILPDCYIYISHLDSEYQYWPLPCYPDSVSDSMASTYQSTNALGRSAPVYTYSSSGPRTVNITLRFHRDMFEDDIRYAHITTRPGEDKADHFIRSLQAISVPKYNLSNKAIEPPIVGIRLGAEVFIKGVVTSGIDVTYSKPILSNEKYAGIEISFSVSEVDPYDASTVFTNGSFRGLVSTLRGGLHY